MRKNKLLLLLALLLTAATGAWAQDYYAPSTDEVIILNDVYNAPSSGKSTHSAIAWGGNATRYDKKAGDPNNGGQSTSSPVSCYSVKGTGKGKDITLSITGVSKVIVYHERNSSRYIELRDGSKTGDIIGSGQKNTYYTEVELTATNQYSIFLHGTSTGSDDQDFYVYAIKLIAAPAAPAAPAAGYTVSLKDGVKDADKWTVKVGDGQAQALPIGGLKGDGKETVTLQYTGRLKVKGVKATSEAAATDEPEATYTLLSAATTADCGKVVCAAGHLHDAKTAVPTGCTAVGILGKVTETGHGLILALKNATNQTWNTINGWTSTTDYAGTTLKVLPDDGARSTNLASYTALGETAVSNWAVAQKSDYEAIFTNLGSTRNSGGMTYDNNVNAYITTGVGGTAMSGSYWSATQDDDYDAWYFLASYWDNEYKTNTYYVRPVLGFGGEAAAKEPATVTTAPKGAAVVGVKKTTALVSGGVADGGTLMYQMTTTNTKPTSTDGFSDAVPTAQTISASGTVYVWYYVKGDDTHSDSEIAATAIEVPVADIVWDATNVSGLELWGTDEYEVDGVKLSGNAENISAGWVDYGDPATLGIVFEPYESGGYTFKAPDGKAFKKIVMKAQSPAGWYEVNLGDGWTFVGDETNCTVTWKDSAASSVELLPDTDDFSGAAPVKSIGFYLSE